ncbi:WD40/YVTN/BNR-like repeat-containing protein [Shewanella waksmanii]|uniref:WD40/YVTN/BNR-like repeat-containing protein n=1 Tax=Shewanella waksmanii TaxID=213783 RepID=UPI00048F5760|nr:YCF48-related protein [Shewanella waksmanii]
MLFSMLRFVVVSFISLSLFISAYAQSVNEIALQPLADQSLVFDIATFSNTAIAVGERGHLFKFNGQWQQVSSPTVALLTNAFLVNADQGWAVGHDATILYTQDAGQSWQVQMSSPEIEKPLLDILMFDEKSGVAVGAYGLFYRTQDGGKTWQSEFHHELLFEEDVAYLEELKAEDEALYLSERSTLLPHFNRIVRLNSGALLMVGELGLVATSDDLGFTWQKQDFLYEGSLFNGVVTETGVYVMGLRGHLFYSNTGTGQWQEISLPTQSTINGGIVLNDSTVRLVGNAGVILDVKSDGEAKLVAQRQGENLVSIMTDPQGQLWIAGTKGFVKLEQE